MLRSCFMADRYVSCMCLACGHHVSTMRLPRTFRVAVMRFPRRLPVMWQSCVHASVMRLPRACYMTVISLPPACYVTVIHYLCSLVSSWSAIRWLIVHLTNGCHEVFTFLSRVVILSLIVGFRSPLCFLFYDMHQLFHLIFT